MRILVADDDIGILQLVSIGDQVERASDAQQVLVLLEDGMNGFELTNFMEGH